MPGPTGRACDQTTAWALLGQHFHRAGAAFDLRQAFADDAGRFERLSAASAVCVCGSVAGTCIDAATTQALLLQLAQRMPRRSCIAMPCSRAKPINATEGRAVLHTLLRCRRPVPRKAVTLARASTAERGAHATLDAMLAFAETLRADPDITDVVNIGIGGSDLGPADGGAGARRLRRQLASACTSSATWMDTN
jgi:glucose-6-phosphate isomerase